MKAWLGICVKVQQLRKRNDYEVTDNIAIMYDGNDAVAAAIESFADYIKQRLSQ